jgi:hypothetical protein
MIDLKAKNKDETQKWVTTSAKKHNGPNSVMITPYVAFPVSWLIKSLLYQ